MVLREEIMHRSNCFKLLSACFYEPDKKLFIEERLCLNLAEQLGRFSPGAAAQAEVMNIGLQEASQDQLSVEYAALFVGPFELIAAPYGSVYLEKNRMLMEDSTLNCQRFYQDAGLTVDLNEPPDHIVIELEFMYYLCSREATKHAEEKTDEARRFRDLQIRFFRHATGWMPEFSSLIRDGATTAYYKALGSCLALFFDYCREFYHTPIET